MEISNFLGLSLPSRDNDTDIADINVLSANFIKLDDFCGNLEERFKDIEGDYKQALELLGGTV